MSRRALAGLLVAGAVAIAACGGTSTVVADPRPAPRTTAEAPDTTLAREPDTPGSRADRGALQELLDEVVADLEDFWREEYPAAYGGTYRELEGGVFAVSQESRGVPGCGTPRTTYADVEGNAFYCADGDFIAYDAQRLVPDLNDRYNAFVPALVLAHEWGHAVQARAGLFDSQPTIVLEQQADCFAGAWTKWLQDGRSNRFQALDEESLTFAVAGLVEFRDEPGDPAEDPDAHGSAFDRVRAFQEGFEQGTPRCSRYPEDPPVITQIPFTVDDALTGGNLDYTTNVQFTTTDLDRFWRTAVQALGATYDPVDRAVPVTRSRPGRCGDDRLGPDDLGGLARWCEVDDTVLFSDGGLRDLNDELGDFAAAATLAAAWAVAQEARLGLGLSDAGRTLFADCATGAWAGDVNAGNARLGDSVISLSAGDLDEAISAFLIADRQGMSNVSVFRRTDAFRQGFTRGIQACVDRG